MPMEEGKGGREFTGYGIKPPLERIKPETGIKKEDGDLMKKGYKKMDSGSAGKAIQETNADKSELNSKKEGWNQKRLSKLKGR